jgi:hypothetical protein
MDVRIASTRLKRQILSHLQNKKNNIMMITYTERHMHDIDRKQNVCPIMNKQIHKKS